MHLAPLTGIETTDCSAVRCLPVDASRAPYGDWNSATGDENQIGYMMDASRAPYGDWNEELY